MADVPFVRCAECGKPIDGLPLMKYQKSIDENVSPEEALNEIGMHRSDCRIYMENPGKIPIGYAVNPPNIVNIKQKFRDAGMEIRVDNLMREIDEATNQYIKRVSELDGPATEEELVRIKEMLGPDAVQLISGTSVEELMVSKGQGRTVEEVKADVIGERKYFSEYNKLMELLLESRIEKNNIRQQKLVHSIMRNITTKPPEPLVERVSVMTDLGTLNFRYMQTVLKPRKPYIEQSTAPKIEFALSNGVDVTALIESLEL